MNPGVSQRCIGGVTHARVTISCPELLRRESGTNPRAVGSDIGHFYCPARRPVSLAGP